MDNGVRVVDRVLDVLEAISRSKTPMGLNELAEATALSKTTVFRLLATLKGRGYVEKNRNGTYSIGPKLFETVSYHINNLELQTESKPYLATLGAELNLTTHLGILDGMEVAYLEKMDTFPNPRLYTQVGYRSPACCSSMGKCLLSCLAGDELEELLHNYSFKQYTPNTVKNAQELKAVLKKVRLQGWAMDNEEYQTGHRCIGAPIFDYRGDAVAAIGASGPVTQLTDEKLEKVIRSVQDVANDISRRMGYIR